MVLTCGDLLLSLLRVPSRCQAAGGPRISRRGLFIKAKLRRKADANAFECEVLRRYLEYSRPYFRRCNGWSRVLLRHVGRNGHMGESCAAGNRRGKNEAASGAKWSEIHTLRHDLLLQRVAQFALSLILRCLIQPGIVSMETGHREYFTSSSTMVPASGAPDPPVKRHGPSWSAIFF